MEPNLSWREGLRYADVLVVFNEVEEIVEQNSRRMNIVGRWVAGN